MNKEYWELWQSPLFQLIIPLTTGMVAGLWAQGSGFSHLLFFKGLLLVTALAVVVCHTLLHRFPRIGALHAVFSGLIFTGLAVFGYLLCFRSVPVLQLDFLSFIREKLLKVCQCATVTPKYMPLLSALLLGEKGSLDAGMKEAFRTAGISHVLALSGLHIGMIAVGIRLLIPRIIPLYKVWHLLLLWLYVGVVGFPVSAVRAALMLSLWWLNPYSKQHVFNLDIVLLAAIILLVYNPHYLLDVGFQMSFCAVTAILFFQPSWRYSERFSQKPQQWFWVCISAQIGVLPLTLYYFGTFPTYFLIANLLITPIIIPCIIYLGMLMMILSFISPELTSILAVVLDFLIKVQFWIVEGVSKLPGAVIFF